MLQEALHEFHSRKRHGCPGLFAGFVSESNLAVFHADQPPVGKGNPIDIGCQVFQGGFSVTNRFAMDYPGFIPGFGRRLGEDLGSFGFEGIAECGAEYFSKGRAGHQEFRLAGIHSPVSGSMPPAGTI